MKAKDLMIGDWVMRGNFAREPMQVYSIRPDINTVHMVFNGMGIAARIDQINPIPLTPEILEKNGFIRRGENQWYINNKARLDLGILSFGIDDGCGVGFCLMPNADFTFFAKYVHELQHALRLCGIEKEIEL